ncbi:hypothetical protein ACOSQ3_004672 [Xanthoceras sorbifolium]
MTDYLCEEVGNGLLVRRSLPPSRFGRKGISPPGQRPSQFGHLFRECTILKQSDRGAIPTEYGQARPMKLVGQGGRKGPILENTNSVSRGISFEDSGIPIISRVFDATQDSVENESGVPLNSCNSGSMRSGQSSSVTPQAVSNSIKVMATKSRELYETTTTVMKNSKTSTCESRMDDNVSVQAASSFPNPTPNKMVAMDFESATGPRITKWKHMTYGAMKADLGRVQSITGGQRHSEANDIVGHK